MRQEETCFRVILRLVILERSRRPLQCCMIEIGVALGWVFSNWRDRRQEAVAAAVQGLDIPRAFRRIT